MKPSYEELEQRLIESERYGRQTDITIDNLEMQLAQMAAENAGLKAAAEFATAPDMWIEQADGMLDYRYCEWYVDVLKAAMETPATDAFLAEVRARELESLAGVAETMMVKFANQGASEIPEAKGWEMIYRQASQRAAQLRKGVQS